jgi:hypothetical protein
MKQLLDKLRHTVACSGLMEGHEPWVEINVGQDGIPRAAIRSVLFPAEANGLMRAATNAKDLPPGSQVVFSHDNDDCEGRMYFVVTTDPPTLIDRAVDMLSGICTGVAEIRPGYAKCFMDE